MVGPTTVHEERLRSRYLFVPAARKLLNELFKLSIQAAQLTDYKLNVKYSEGQSEVRLLVPKLNARPLSISVATLEFSKSQDLELKNPKI